jgi:hypothetical protein
MMTVIAFEGLGRAAVQPATSSGRASGVYEEQARGVSPTPSAAILSADKTSVRNASDRLDLHQAPEAVGRRCGNGERFRSLYPAVASVTSGR